MTETHNQDLHAEHRQWLDNLSLWKDELQIWREELSTAADEFHEVANLLKQHAAALYQHGFDMKRAEMAIRKHEHLVALAERGRPDGIEGGHMGDRKTPLMADTHEQMKKHHHKIMARLANLRKAIAESV